MEHPTFQVFLDQAQEDPAKDPVTNPIEYPAFQVFLDQALEDPAKDPVTMLLN